MTFFNNAIPPGRGDPADDLVDRDERFKDLQTPSNPQRPLRYPATRCRNAFRQPECAEIARPSRAGSRKCDLPVMVLPVMVSTRIQEPRIKRFEEHPMHIMRRRGWELPEHLATPEHLFFDRRAFVLAAGATAAAFSPAAAMAQRVVDLPDPTKDLYPAKRNEKFTLDRPITDEAINTTYNNFYEFGSSKSIARAAQALRLRPWTVKIDGMVDKPQEVGVDDLVRKMPLEERLYRHRCVEAWGMAIPWTGFPLSKLVEFAKPTSSAKYVRMETFLDPAMASGQKASWYPWPYIEGVTMAEAVNDLAFVVTGAYGKPVAKSQGAPLRLALPWKYGFKSIKSITRVTFTDQRPKTFWEALQASEYGFWANINPQVSHPRWSQATEQVIGTSERRPTLLFNGYGEYVADLYRDLKGERLWA
jgi:methionine sulfoxide reductase catalytic subunit